MDAVAIRIAWRYAGLDPLTVAVHVLPLLVQLCRDPRKPGAPPQPPGLDDQDGKFSLLNKRKQDVDQSPEFEASQFNLDQGCGV